MAKVQTRLFIDHPLEAGQTVPLSREQAHYLGTVMRLRPGDAVAVFNGRDGEWQATLDGPARGPKAMLRVATQTAPQRNPPDLWLLFAPIKKARTDFIVEKAAELGAARIMPILTERSQTRRIARDRLQAHAIEAAEQCGGTFVPPVGDLRPLDEVLRDWPADRQLMFCDEEEAGAGCDLSGAMRGPWAILIGPEGGFSAAERDRLRDLPFSWVVSLGPRVLRADTATVAALTLWQDRLGDWR
jgi:16S rRNA (uracil1498-N3)-methyltransferase